MNRIRLPEEASRSDRAQQIYDRYLTRASRDDEYNDWAEYRAALTDFITGSTPAGGSLLILGAGKCSDLDLRKLAAHFGPITLSDYRPELADEAWHCYGLSPSERLAFAGSDYVGIPEEAYVEYTRLLLDVMQRLKDGAGESLEEAAGPQLRTLLEGLEQIYRDNGTYEVHLGEKAYDHAVVCGVHSQLNNSFRGLFQYARKDAEDRWGSIPFAEELNAAIFAVSREHTEHLVRRFNEAVFAAVRQGVIYGYERSILYTPEGEHSPVIGTVDGARQAGELIADIPAEHELNCLWPLSRRRGIRFEMSVCYLPVAER